jgi:hypothetical protein
LSRLGREMAIKSWFAEIYEKSLKNVNKPATFISLYWPETGSEPMIQ